MKDMALVLLGFSAGVWLAVREIDRSNLDLLPPVRKEVDLNRRWSTALFVGTGVYLASRGLS